MSTMKIEDKKCLTPEFRVSFPHVFKPNAYKPGQEPKYRLTMLFDKETDLKELKRAVKNAVIEYFGSWEKKPAEFVLPFHDGNTKKDLAGYENKIYVNTSSKSRPGVIDRKKQPIAETDGSFYAGCYARATLIAFVYNDGEGAAFALQNIIKTGDGDQFSGKKSAQDEFADLELPAEGEATSASEEFDAELGF